jgi:hypothetical protein
MGPCTKVKLDFSGFQSQKKQNIISRPKARKKCSRRDPGRECRAVCGTNNPQVWKDNSARGGGKEQHNRVGQSRGVGTEAPQWASELVWTHRLEEKSFSSAWDQPPVIQSVATGYADIFQFFSILCTDSFSYWKVIIERET